MSDSTRGRIDSDNTVLNLCNSRQEDSIHSADNPTGSGRTMSTSSQNDVIMTAQGVAPSHGAGVAPSQGRGDTAKNTDPNIAPSNPDLLSAQRKTWSARLRDKLEKREKETTAAAAEQSDEIQEKRIRVEQPASGVTASGSASGPRPAARRPSGGHKKNKHKAHQLQFVGGATPDGSGFGGGMLGGGGPRPTQGKSTPYHLTPSLLEDVLNEKKMSLMRSPEVIEQMQMLQRNVSINRLLGTAPTVVKTESVAGGARVKIEQSCESDSHVATIGEVTMVTIKKEGDNSDNDQFNNTAQHRGTLAHSDSGPETAGNVSKDTAPSAPSSVHMVDNPLDLTAHKYDSTS